MKIFHSFLLFLFIAQGIHAQVVDDKSEIIARRINMLLDQQNEDFQFDEQLYDRLEYYYDNPMNLNSVSKTQLKELALLNDYQVNSLLMHMTEYGELLSIHELQTINGFNLQTIELIQPFICVKSVSKMSISDFKSLINKGEHDVFLRYSRVMNQKEGFREQAGFTDYYGSPDKYYLRYRFSAVDKIRWGITAEKDAGEEFFKGTQKNGFDYYSAHLMMNDIGPFHKTIIGDYQLKFGQGLTFWSGYSYSNSESRIDIKRNSSGVLPHISVDENDFLRGVASSIELGKFNFTGFYSKKSIDARMSGETFSSFSLSGQHRTSSEVETKDVVGEEVMGGRGNYLSKNIELGITAANLNYDHSFTKGQQLYDLYDFDGRSLLKLGLDYDLFIKNSNFYGEVSMLDGNISFINGYYVLLTPSISVSASIRNYSTSLVPLKTNPISQWSSLSGEMGLFYGLEYKPSGKITLSASSEVFKNNWLKYSLSGLGMGNQHYVGIDYKPNKGTRLSLYFFDREKPENISRVNDIPKIINKRNQKIRANLNYQVTKDWFFSNRAELHFYEKVDKEKGFLLYQDVIYRPKFKNYSFSMRYALFNTKSFNSGIYAYERDVLYAYQFPVYFNEGSRFYLVGKYKLTKKVTFWIRFSNWFYIDQKNIGTGHEKIDGSTKSEIKVQLRMKIE